MQLVRTMGSSECVSLSPIWSIGQLLAWVVLIVILFPGVVLAAEWSDGEKALVGTFVVGQVVNYSQTMNTLRDDDWHELNPVIDSIYDEYGRGGIIAWKVGTTAALVYAADRLPKYRRLILAVSNTIVWSVVGHDVYVGVGFSW